MTTAPVFLVDALPEGEHAVLDGPEGRHAATVRRLRAGEELMLCDGRGSVAACEVTSVASRDTLELRLLRRWAEPAPSPRLVVAQALVKGDRGELAVELATEAGVDEIVPWRAARSVARWEDGPRGDKAPERWRVTAREAAKQSRRSWVPEVTGPVGTEDLAKLARAAGAALLLESSATTRVTEIAIPTKGNVLAIIGPEGGISAEEKALLEGAGARLARLGPNVLRTSTAGAVAVSVLSVLTGRWR